MNAAAPACALHSLLLLLLHFALTFSPTVNFSSWQELRFVAPLRALDKVSGLMGPHVTRKALGTFDTVQSGLGLPRNKDRQLDFDYLSAPCRRGWTHVRLKSSRLS